MILGRGALLVILFQSWAQIRSSSVMAVPGGLLGIIWILALTGTTINVESLMGSIDDDRHFGVELNPGGELRQRSARTRDVGHRWR